MAEIVPAILERDFKEIKNKLSALRGMAKTVQIDICDGIFVPTQTWPFSSGGIEDTDLKKIINEEEGMPYWQDFDFEIDLMITDAVENFDLYAKLGAKSVIFHLEALKNKEDFKEFIEGIDIYVRDNLHIGVAINPTTDVEEIFPIVPCVDFVQVMGIDHPGKQGEEFDEKAVEMVKALREKFSDLVISVDGSVNFDTAPLLISAGADRLTIGSAIFGSSDIIGTIKRFQEL